MGRAARLAILFVVLALLGQAATAATYDPPPLEERLTPDLVARVFPGAERLGPVEGSPESVAVYQGEEVVGYLFSTIDVVAMPGYSGVPFDVIAGVTIDGLITGSEVIYHHEAFIERDPVRQVQIADYLTMLAGTNRDSPRSDLVNPDFVAGATVSARAMRLAVWDSARLVLRARSGRPVVTEPTLDVESFFPRSAEELLEAGALVHSVITNAEMEAWLAAEAGADAALDSRIGRTPERGYLDVFVGLATPAVVGRNLLEATRYDELFGHEDPPMAVMFVTRGDFNPRGVSYLNSSTGYRLDRVQVVQGNTIWTFVKDDFIRVSGRTTGIVDALDAGILFLPEDFDPLLPWRMEFLAHGTTAAGEEFARVMPVEVMPSEAYILMPEPEPPPPWVEAWTDARPDLIVLVTALTILTLLLLYQHRLTRHRRLYSWVRSGFLVFTLVWIGWIAGGQLSTLHLLNYAMAPFKDFGWAFYLAEPLILILAVYTLFALLLLGRGVFCGWLCPFGAMQELLAKIARFFRIPQWNPSFRVQRYAWLGKYVAAAGLVIVAIGWPEAEPLAAEVEPFKTAITSMFSRPLVYVGYAAILLGIGLFTERAYCRFLCPLGGILATLDRLHIFNMLKRRPECGTSCHLCERSCPVKAIRPTGEIVMAECFQCLDCQVEYYDDRRCPPLAKQRKARERGQLPETDGALPAFARSSAT